MPFTVSHAVVALPFRRSRTWPAAAVAAGAMAPDVPLFAPVGVPYSVTHQLWAAPTVDTVLGALLLLLWGLAVRPGLAALAPASVARRLPAGTRRPALPRVSVRALAAVALGATTHVVWDTFTHPGRLGTRLVPLLQLRLGRFELASLLQYASSLVGTLVLIAVAVAALATARTAHVRPPALGRAAVPARIAAVLVVVLVVVLAAARAGGPAAAMFDILTTGVDAVLVVAAVTGLAVGARTARDRRG